MGEQLALDKLHLLRAGGLAASLASVQGHQPQVPALAMFSTLTVQAPNIFCEPMFTFGMLGMFSWYALAMDCHGPHSQGRLLHV